MIRFGFGFAVGALAFVALNHLRWAVFPLSGGPRPLNLLLGGPPEATGRLENLP